VGTRQAIDQLESRTLLAASPVMGPMSTTSLETLNVQLQPVAVSAFSRLMPLITAEDATVQPTIISGLFEVQGPSAKLGHLTAELAADAAVEYANPVQMVHAAIVPNDPQFISGGQWGLNGTWGINAPTAWNTTTGSTQVIVADTDTGIDYNHPDLVQNLWLNQAEIPSSVLPNLTDVDGDGKISFFDLNQPINQGPGKISDSDGDGVITGADVIAPTSSGGWSSGSTQDGSSYADDLIGWNFVSNTNSPYDDATSGHGTHTAGIIGAVGNNAVGVAGTNWTVQIMPVKFLDSTGSGTDTNAAAAIHYAVDHGAKVVNASWGGSGTDPTIADAIHYAASKGVIFVAAAGNSGSNDDSSWFSPASYSTTYSNMIAVANIGSTGALASSSNYGPKSVQLAAPGSAILSTLPGGKYGTLSGTSMATPFVTGTVALGMAAHPTWSLSQVIDAVLDHTTPDSNLVGKVATGGVLNAAAAVANTDGPHIVSATPDGSINNPAGLSSIQLTFNEEINPATFTPMKLTLTGPNGIISNSSISVTAVSGSNGHQFVVAFPAQTAAGIYTLKVGTGVQDWYGNAMDQKRNGVNGEASDTFTATIRQTAPGSSDLLSLTGVPTTDTAGTPATVTVTALSPNGGTDTSYLGTVHFTSSDGQAVLPVNYTFTAADAGRHTFTVKLKTAGIAQSITATDTANPAIIGTEENITVQAAAAQSLKVAGFPTTVTAGTAQTFTVTAYDAYGNLATSYTGTVHFSSTDSQASLPANYTITPEEQGTFTFTATLKTAGTQSIMATDTATATITGTESGIMVQAAAAQSLKLTGFPTAVTAGTSGSITVTVYGTNGTVATGYLGTIHFTSSDPQAVLPADYTFTTADAGVHTFSGIKLKTAGTQSSTATDTATAATTGTESGITVNPSAASSLSVTGFANPTIAGTVHTFTVTARDPYGNIATGYTGTVSFSSNDSQAILPANYTFTAGDAGVHTFSAALATAGSANHYLRATDTAKSTITGAQSSITTLAAAAQSLSVTRFPTTATAGTLYTVTVTAYDAYGNVATGYTGTIHFTSSDGQAALPANYTFTASNGGRHSFGVALKTAGTQSITATDTATSSITGTESGITVQAAAAHSLTVTGFPSPDTAGTAHSITVTAYDAYGNVATSFLGTVSFSSSDSQAVLPASYTFTAGDGGVHTFTVTLETIGTQSITATDSVDKLSGSETGIVVQ
jgi:subtilisin family serine protease